LKNTDVYDAEKVFSKLRKIFDIYFGFLGHLENVDKVLSEVETGRTNLTSGAHEIVTVINFFFFLM